jgi:transposase InsO family protein
VRQQTVSGRQWFAELTRLPWDLPGTARRPLIDAVETLIYQLRRAHPGWGPRRLVHELARQGVEPLPSRASIYRALRRGRLVEPQARRRQKAVWRRWQRQRPMQLWQMDVMGGLELAAGGEAKLVTGIDDHSRFCVAAGVVERATARAVCAGFASALARHGVPEELLTDNGKVFTGRFAPIRVRCCSTASAERTASPTG